MTKNPALNGVSASAYIILVVTVMNLVTQPLKNKPDTFFAPVVFLSLLTFSVAVMGYLFFYQPLQLLIDGKKKEALRLFFQTIGVFGILVLISMVLLFSGVI